MLMQKKPLNISNDKNAVQVSTFNKFNHTCNLMGSTFTICNQTNFVLFLPLEGAEVT